MVLKRNDLLQTFFPSFFPVFSFLFPSVKNPEQQELALQTFKSRDKEEIAIRDLTLAFLSFSNL